MNFIKIGDRFLKLFVKYFDVCSHANMSLFILKKSVHMFFKLVHSNFLSEPRKFYIILKINDPGNKLYIYFRIGHLF